jgi:hypothetical protein
MKYYLNKYSGIMLLKKLDTNLKDLFHLKLYNDKLATNNIDRDCLKVLRFQLSSTMYNQLEVSMTRHLLPVKCSIYFDYDIDDHNERHKDEV